MIHVSCTPGVILNFPSQLRNILHMLFQANSVPLATDEEPSTTDAVATFRGP